MSDKRGRPHSAFFWLFCLLAAPLVVVVLVLGSVFIENKALRTHHIEETLNGWHVDAPFRWVTRVTGLGPDSRRLKR
jgi:hypothetical protein